MQPSRMTLQWLDQSWRWLTEPAPAIQEPERRRQARLLSSLLLALILVITFAVTIRMLLGALWQDPDTLISLIAIVALVGVYGLSRTGYYLASASITVAIIFVLIHAAPFFVDRDDQALFYAPLPILLSGLLLPPLAIFGVATISIGSTFLWMALTPEAASDIYLPPLINTIIMAAVMMVFIRHRDLLERDRQAAMREREAQYRNLFENAPIPVWEQDLSAVKAYIEGLQSQGVNDFRAYFEGHPEAVIQGAKLIKVINLNKASLELYQANSKEELMRDLTQLFAQESYEALKEELIAIVQGESRFEQETVRQTLTGEKKNIVLSWSVMPGYEETFSKVLVSVVDITERKHLEEQLRQAQKMEAIGRLAGGVAHDFNNLLTVIKGYSGLLMESLHREASQYKDVEQIEKAAERAALLTNQLLAFSRKQMLQPVILDLNLVVMNTDKMLRRLIGENIELVTILDPNLGKVKVDPSQMEQVVINLAINARDAMPFGGKLTIETANVIFDEEYIRHHVEAQLGPQVMLAIRDTGQGMDKETQSHLFEPFFTTKEQGKGTGLGLATVHGIVAQSGGHIWVHSEINQGTTFKVYLPQVEETISPTNQKGQRSTLPLA